MIYAVINTDGTFAGVTYPEMTDAIKEHHTQYGQTFMRVLTAPVDVSPIVEGEEYDHISNYGSPTPEQIEANRIRVSNEEHQTYLDSTDWYVMRKVETDEAIPAEVLTKRAEARVALGR